MLNIRPLSDRIVVEPSEAELKTKGGIVIPDTADKDKPMRGQVKAVGKGKYVGDKLIPLDIQVGQEILFGKYAGTNVKIADKEYLIMREDDVMGVLE
jgi:chaperonin GroES